VIPRLAAALAALALALPAPARAEEPALEGLWRYHAVATSGLHGPVTLTQAGGLWRASVGGRTASGRAVDGRLRLVFAQGQGELRARLEADGPRAYWVQPGRSGRPGGGDPGGANQPFATPLALQPAGPHAWRGVVRPLPASFTLWLKVFRGEDGALTAAFRNPEANSIGGRTQFLVTQEGERVHFATRPQPGRAPVTLEARLRAGRLAMSWPDAGGEIALSRPTITEAQAFYPRPPGAAPYRYAPPPATGDGWATASAAAVGLDEAALEKIVRDEAASDPAGARPPLIHSILVARHGKLALEEYFFGFDRTQTHDLRSASKSFASVMLGAVMRKDPGLGPQSRIYDLMAREAPFAHPDPRKAQITLAQLMTHSAGLACDDNDDASPGNETTLQTQTAQPDWWKYTLDLPMAHDPGARYAYCSANLNLVGGRSLRPHRRVAAGAVRRDGRPAAAVRPLVLEPDTDRRRLRRRRRAADAARLPEGRPGLSRSRPVARPAHRRRRLGEGLDGAAHGRHAADHRPLGRGLRQRLPARPGRLGLAPQQAEGRRTRIPGLRGHRQRRPTPDRCPGGRPGGGDHRRQLRPGRHLAALARCHRGPADPQAPALSRRRRRSPTPATPNPVSIIAQTAGSGALSLVICQPQRTPS
jgi:hypothetical protein